ncbi:formin-binding protein 4-like isoform X2 [Plodia interpunctella]|uniref:formin-binding protein 4-like isoform X2 n=1 Tax=Plodia interpunctella TaxID=58824 RepID=UPI0023678FC0|nr:formin-binding protein 4-like isoform X2 [Plodia interpunctella]
MNKANPLAGLIGYGDSDDDSDEEQVRNPIVPAAMSAPVAAPPQAPSIATGPALAAVPPGIHPAPVPYCPWSACYDESTGFTYYWNQQTNVVTWEAPPEYLLAVKIAQQHMSRSGSAEVSAEEWQLYQQALAEKQNAQNKAKVTKPTTSYKKDVVPTSGKDRNSKAVKRRRNSEDDPVKIELITSYHNSDSESNDEESPVKPVSSKIPAVQSKKVPAKKIKKPTVEYGPALPPNMEYTVPIGPEMPPELNNEKPKSPANKIQNNVIEHVEVKSSPKINIDEIQDDDVLLKRLRDKAKLLEKLGGEIPSELQKIIEVKTLSRTASPKNIEGYSKIDTNIDDLLDEIEKKELPKVKTKAVSNPSSQSNSVRNSPKSNNGDCTPPLDDKIKPLFPSSKAIVEEIALFPSAMNIKDGEKLVINEEKEKSDPVVEKKSGNMYLMDANEPIENISRKKLRISNSVLPERKKTEPVSSPAYNTKYSQHIEGFSNERTGLGFTKEDEAESAPKNTISYGNGLLFTKGEVLNEDKKDEDLDDLTELVEAKLKYLNSLQTAAISPVQEMLIQMQTLVSAFRSGALGHRYWARWGARAAAELRAHEAAAAPRGWLCVFQRSEGRYKYRRECDGFEQWEYPALANTDMDISTTPPHPGAAALEEPTPPPPPPSSECPPTPPPPVWDDPPPPGTDDPPPPPPLVVAQEPPKKPEKKQEIGDALLSFYNDIAELEKTAPPPPPPPPAPSLSPGTSAASPVVGPPLPPDEEKRDVKKKKSKVKISASIGMKHKTVSSLVAKWQQVAEEINSD